MHYQHLIKTSPSKQGVPPLLDLEWLDDVPALTMLIPVLDRYIRHYLRRSSDVSLQDLAQRATARLRLLGVQITETGARACASPVGRVLAYSQITGCEFCKWS